MQLTLPEVVPVMTLANAALLPHTVMPLYIFEQRYRRMLADALAGSRAFALANDASPQNSQIEVPAQIATLGIIRLSSLNHDGTSTIMLYGAQRIRILSTDETAAPYLVARVQPVPSEADLSPETATAHRKRLEELIQKLDTLRGSSESQRAIEICSKIEDLEACTHFAMQAYCNSVGILQQVLEARRSSERLKIAIEYLSRQVALFSLLKAQEDDPGDRSHFRN